MLRISSGVSSVLAVLLTVNSVTAQADCRQLNGNSSGGTQKNHSNSTSKKSVNVTELLRETRPIDDLKNTNQLGSSITVVAFLMSQWNSNIDFVTTHQWISANVEKNGVNKALMLPILYMYQAFHLSGFVTEATRLGPLINTLNPKLGHELSLIQNLQIARTMNLDTDFTAFNLAHQEHHQAFLSAANNDLSQTNDPFAPLVFGPGSLFDKRFKLKIDNRQKPMKVFKNQMVAMGGPEMTCQTGCLSSSAAEVGIKAFVGVKVVSKGTKNPWAVLGGALVGAAIGVSTEAPKADKCMKDCHDTWSGEGRAKEEQDKKNVEDAKKIAEENKNIAKQNQEIQKQNEKVAEENAKLAEELKKEKIKQEEKAKKEAEEKKKQEDEKKKKDEESKQKAKEKEIYSQDWSKKQGNVVSDCSRCSDAAPDTYIATPYPPGMKDEKPEPFAPTKYRQWREWQIRSSPEQDDSIYEGDSEIMKEAKKNMVIIPKEPYLENTINFPSEEELACKQKLNKDMITNAGRFEPRLPLFPSFGSPVGPSPVGAN